MDYIYHYHPKINWINDPNGLCFFKGLYHIYYQYNHKGNEWGNISWGHATTLDFIKYKEEEVAIKNDKPYDEDGCFSGNSIIIDDTLYIYYTSVANNKQTQSVAYSKDGYNFTKYENNPIIDTNFEARDPYVFMYNNELYMLLGTLNKVLLFKGKDPFEFEYVGNLIELNEFIECPNLIKIGDKYLFKYSSMITRKDYFYLGSFDGLKFVIEKEVLINMPKNYYASQMFRHNDDIILIGWIFNDNFKTEKIYNGVLSIPRIVYLDNNNVKTKFINSNKKKIVDLDITEEI